MRQAKVTLGGREFTIEALPIRQSKVWRESLAMPFVELTHALESAQTVEINQLGDIADLVRKFSGTLLGSVDKMLDLLMLYSPTLTEDREWIEENAFDDEALAAFTEVLKLAYPLGEILALVAGPQVSRTSSNSALRNGATGTKHATARQRNR